MNIKKRTEEINKAIDFHIEAKDYLPTLATYFLILSTEKGLRPNIAAQLAQMSYEMLYAEKYYQIVKRDMPAQSDLSIPENRMWQYWQSEPSSQKNRKTSKN